MIFFSGAALSPTALYHIGLAYPTLLHHQIKSNRNNYHIITTTSYDSNYNSNYNNSNVHNNISNFRLNNAII